MIRTLQSYEELLSSRSQLSDREIDFTLPSQARFWRVLYYLRFRTALPAADIMKSWDVANALRTIESTVADRESPILDMGCFNSEILYVLHELGYRQLHGCDLNPLCRWMPFWHHIHYRMADLTCTPYHNRYFSAITCLSVIEHGVPLEMLVKEVSRLLRPGGVFIFTTDYDGTGQPHEISPDSRVFGLDWKIFTRDELLGLIKKFEDAGFSLLDPVNVLDTHVDCPIKWNEQRYTFTLVALKCQNNEAAAHIDG